MTGGWMLVFCATMSIKEVSLIWRQYVVTTVDD